MTENQYHMIKDKNQYIIKKKKNMGMKQWVIKKQLQGNMVEKTLFTFTISLLRSSNAWKIK